MKLLTKKTLLITLPLMLTACAYDAQHYIPYGVNVVTPAPRPVYVNHSYQQPYQQPNHYEHNNYNEHHDNGKHKGQNKHKSHND